MIDGTRSVFPIFGAGLVPLISLLIAKKLLTAPEEMPRFSCSRGV